ncbi:type IV toxin-antitoxin system AbiEi family antitoxin domain-containing protein [Pedococcus aerophilus]
MELHELARDSVVSAAEAAQLGLGPSDLRRMRRLGSVRRLIRGWYAVCPPGAPTPPWEGADHFDTARRQHRLLTVALIRSFEGRAVASHQSALVLHDIPLWKSDLATAHLCRRRDDHSRHRPAATLHPACQAEPVLSPPGYLTVPVPQAVVQVGLHPVGPGRGTFPFESLVAADAALHHGLTTLDEIQQVVHAHAGHPGIAGVRRLLERADGRHESVGETRLAHTLRLLGYRFTPQVWVTAEGRRWRADFELDDEPVIVEFDGLAKYTGGLPNPTPEQSRQALATEKWREDRLRDTGREVTRFVWAEVDDLPLVRSRVDAAIVRSRRRLRI